MTQFSSLYTGLLDHELGTNDSTTLFTTGRRQAAVNRGQAEFCRLTDCLERQTTLVLTGGVAEYDVNTTVVIPGGDFRGWAKNDVWVTYTDAAGTKTILAGEADFPKRDVAWLNDALPGWQDSTVASSVAQLPTLYYERLDGAHRYLGFYPVPSTGSSATITATIPYLAMPTPLTSDTQQPFVVGSGSRLDLTPYHQALVHYAAYQLEKLRRDEMAGQQQFKLFMGYVTQYLQDKREKTAVGVGFVKQYFQRGVQSLRQRDVRR